MITLIYFAAVAVILVAAARGLYFWAGAEAAAVRPDARVLRPGDRAILLGLSAIVVAVAFARLYLDRYLVYDDAFMSYRYARNLAFGHGLSWNPGEPPVEGYTNFLLVVVLAPFVRLGMDPLVVTRAMSALAAFGLGALVYRRARRESSPGVALAVAITYLASNAAFSIAMVGLETILFTLALYLAFHHGSAYLESPGDRSLRWTAGALFASVLLRPEGMFLAVILPVVACWPAAQPRVRPGRRGLALAALYFALPLALYLGWKLVYFGGLLPNPAYIKVPRGGLLVPSGVESVGLFLGTHWKLLALAVASGFLVRAVTPARLVAALVVGAYCVFFLRVDTLMNIYNRFLFPASVFLFELSLPAVRRGHELWLERKDPWPQKALAVLVLFMFVAFPSPEAAVGDLKLAAKRGYNFPPVPSNDPQSLGHSGHIRDISRVLGTFPGMDHLTIASVDAGVIAYYSNARHVDTVGLNDRAIAHERDVGRLTSYFFGRRPDIIFQRERLDGSLITYGHGVLGNHALWADHPGWDDYQYAGTVIDVDPWRHELHLYVRKSSPQAAPLREFIAGRVADFVHPTPPVKLGTARSHAAGPRDGPSP